MQRDGYSTPHLTAYVDYAGMLFGLKRFKEITTILQRGCEVFKRFGMSKQVETMENYINHYERERELNDLKAKVLTSLQSEQLPELQTNLYKKLSSIAYQDDLSSFAAKGVYLTYVTGVLLSCETKKYLSKYWLSFWLILAPKNLKLLGWASAPYKCKS